MCITAPCRVVPVSAGRRDNRRFRFHESKLKSADVCQSVDILFISCLGVGGEGFGDVIMSPSRVDDVSRLAFECSLLSLIVKTLL